MIILLFAIFFIIMVVLIVCGVESKYWDEELFAGAFFAGLVAIALLIGTFILTGSVMGGRKLDEKISLYQEANTAIEEKIANSITDYIGYETGMFKDLDINAIVMKYPELKANELVQEEIKVYQDNNKKILELKEAKIDLDVKRWWLYFGGEE